MQGHHGPISGLATQPMGEGRWLLVSTAGDEEVVVWESNAIHGGSVGGLTFEERQRIPTGFQMQNALDLVPLRESGW